jgi:cyanophycinase
MKKLLIIIFCVFQFSVHAEVKRYFVGNDADVRPKLHGPAFHLQGGGTDVDAAFQWMFDQVRGCTDCPAKLDVVVLRASGDNGYNDYLLAMKGVDSVETLVISDRKDAELKDVEERIKNAEVVFFAGGDQCNYVKYFKGTPVETAVESVMKRGGGIGGTSAGEAILGDATYDACTGSTTGAEGLSDPYHESISFTYDFLHLPNMKDTITDQHLVERDRIGRTFAFLARQIQDKKFKKIWAVAIDRETSLALNKYGLGTIMGKGPAYFILADHAPEVCKPKEPLTFSNFKIWKRNTGETFDLKHRPDKGYYLRSVTKGILDKNPYNP